MIQKKKLLMIHEVNHIGGGQTYTDNILKTLRKKRNLEVIYLENESNIKILRSLLFDDADTIIWNVYTFKYFFLILVATVLRKKNILIVYGLWFLESALSRWKKYPFLEQLRVLKVDLKLYLSQLLIFILVSDVVHLSQYGKKLYSHYYGFLRKKEKIMYPGIDNSLKVNSISRHEARSILHLSSDTFIILMLGRLDFRKNYHLAPDLLKELKSRKNTKKSELIFVFSSSKEANDFSYLEFLFERIREAGVGNDVKIVSGVTRENIALFYKSADIFLMLSEKYETFGLVTLEALMMKCPVFGLHFSATPEILDSYATQFLSKSKNVTELADLIEDYQELDSKKKKTILADLERKTNRFQWEKSIKIMLS